MHDCHRIKNVPQTKVSTFSCSVAATPLQPAQYYYGCCNKWIHMVILIEYAALEKNGPPRGTPSLASRLILDTYDER